MNQTDILFRFCDLTEANYQALIACEQAFGTHPKIHPAMRKAMEGMIDEDCWLRPYGREVLQRARKYIENPELTGRDSQFVPEVRDMVIANRLRKEMAKKTIYPTWKIASVHVKLLIALYNSPGLSFRYLCSIYGLQAVKDLLRAEWITGVEYRGYPFKLTAQGERVMENIQAKCAR